MAATTATVIFRGRSGKMYGKNVYVPDAGGNLCTWDTGGGKAVSTGPTFWAAPEDMVMLGINIVAQPTATGLQGLINNAGFDGNFLYIANNLNTVTNRDAVLWPVRRGAQFGLLTVT